MCCPLSKRLLPYETIIKAHEGDLIAIQSVLDRYIGHISYFFKMNGNYNSDMEDYIKTKLLESLL
ncbi:MAG: helix-turn-helix domain-containing protein [Candidatus Enterosoma sp.]|nr:helix-turn-helix domain-containing protein [Candidatus Enterosoma sp.]